MMQVFCARHSYVLHGGMRSLMEWPHVLVCWQFGILPSSPDLVINVISLSEVPLWMLDLLGLLCWMLSVLRQDLLCLGWVWIRNPGVSASWVLELQVCATMTSFWTVGLGITGVFDDCSFSPLKPLMLEDSPLAFGKSRRQCRENQQMKCMCNLTLLHSSNVAQSRNLPWEF